MTWYIQNLQAPGTGGELSSPCLGRPWLQRWGKMLRSDSHCLEFCRKAWSRHRPGPALRLSNLQVLPSLSQARRG